MLAVFGAVVVEMCVGEFVVDRELWCKLLVEEAAKDDDEQHDDVADDDEEEDDDDDGDDDDDDDKPLLCRWTAPLGILVLRLLAPLTLFDSSST